LVFDYVTIKAEGSDLARLLGSPCRIQRRALDPIKRWYRFNPRGKR
jgi:hypothetical protein